MGKLSQIGGSIAAAGVVGAIVVARTLVRTADDVTSTVARSIDNTRTAARDVSQRAADAVIEGGEDFSLAAAKTVGGQVKSPPSAVASGDGIDWVIWITVIVSLVVVFFAIAF